MSRMQKWLSYLWLPITAGAILVILYGTLTLADLKIKNQGLEQKQNELQNKITQLENNLGDLRVQVAGVKEEKPSTNRRVLATIDQATSSPEPLLPSPTPTLTATATWTPTPTPTSTWTPTPTPTSTPTITPTPIPTPIEQATVAIEDVGTYTIDLQTDDTAFTILLRAGSKNGFTIEYQTYEGLGAFVTCIANICSHDNFYWAFYYNGSYSMVGASSQSVSDGDTTTWKFESF